MFTDPTVALVLGAFCVFPGAMALYFVACALWGRGLRFRPEPTTSQRVLFFVLAGIALYLGWDGGSTVFLWFVVLSVTALILQHSAPKHWTEGRVCGVWLRPLAVRGVEREGRGVVLCLEHGFRLRVPDVPANQALLSLILDQGLSS